MDDALLTTQEVARLLRVHPKHVYRLLKQGLPSRRVGGEWRFVREEVLRWSGAETARAQPAPAALLAASGDVVIDLLLRELVARGKPLVGLVRADRSSALAWLAARRVTLAGHHGGPAPASLETSRLARLHLVHRAVGIACARAGRMRRLGDLAGKRLATRPVTAGVRARLDRALEDAGLSLRALRVRPREHDSHEAAALAVLRGEADVGLVSEAWARRAGLAFFAVASEPYELLVHADDLGSAPVVGVCEIAQSRPFAGAARAAGYDVTGAGAIRYE